MSTRDDAVNGGSGAAEAPPPEKEWALDEDAGSANVVERLLEESWSGRVERASRRELAVEAVAAALFLAIAVPLAVSAFGSNDIDIALAFALVALYAVASRLVEFPLGAGYVVPSYLVLVPMLLLLPPGAVPLLAACGLALGTAAQAAVRRSRPERILFSVSDAWHSLGPAAVLLAAGAPASWGAEVLLLAFLAGCLVDLVSATLREWAILGVTPRVQVRVVAQAWLVDACIAPLGLIVAHAAQQRPADLLLVLPFEALMFVACRDRNRRIEQSRDRLDQVVRERGRLQAANERALTDGLTKLGNRRRLELDLQARLAAATGDNELVLVLFDLNGFKSYNDTFGHMAGDALLRRLGEKLNAAVGGRGLAYRLGGDEFCVVLDRAPRDMQASIATAREALAERGEKFTVGASFGAVVLPREATTVEYALQLADERMYSQKRTIRSALSDDPTRDVLMRVMQAKQPSLEDHSSEVARLCVRVGRRLGMNGEELDALARAAELHDIGKVAIPESILEKPGPLDDAEWALMRQHTILGERILGAAPAWRPVASIVRATHERWDGAGYPDGLAADRIPLAARVIAVCDAYEAMTSDRCYRQGRTADAARAELRREAGRQFDPQIVKLVLAELEEPAAAREGAPHRPSQVRRPEAQLPSALADDGRGSPSLATG
jgi:diguanylate cyclase (GGDEF)-like protein